MSDRWIRGPQTKIDERTFRRSLLLSWCILKTAEKESGIPWRDRWDVPVRAKDLDLDVDMNTSQVRQLAQDLGGGEEPLVRRVIRDEQ